jgi:hypothetical protein
MTLSRYIDTSRSIRNALATWLIKLATRIADPRSKNTYKQSVLAADRNSLHQPLDLVVVDW